MTDDIDDLARRLRDEASELTRTAWRRLDGGQECCIASILADQAADALIRLRDVNASLCLLLPDNALTRSPSLDSGVGLPLDALTGLARTEAELAIARAEAAEARATAAEARAERLFERLQAIIDWADLALSNPGEFNPHGVRNLDGPVFDEARAALAKEDQP